MSNYFNLELNIEEYNNKEDINNHLILGLRNNPKRKFLFISKLLGKHLACDPDGMDELGRKIASIYNNNKSIEFNSTIISFAETATALGISVFKNIENANEFIHTTREDINNKELKRIRFIEEHSHATNHILYIDELKNIYDNEEIILVDDEITTGKTCLNFIKELNKFFPNKRYVVLSIFNWMDKESELSIKKEVEKISCSIEFNSLYKGDFKFEMINDIDNEEEVSNCTNNKKEAIEYLKLDFKEYVSDKRYIKYSGRFALNRDSIEKLHNIIDEQLNTLNIDVTNKKVLVLGTEEFMYIPMYVAKKISKVAKSTKIYSTTRSPIIPINKDEYPIKNKLNIKSFYNENIDNYIYNLGIDNYDEILLFIELDQIEKYESIIEEIFRRSNSLSMKVITCNNIGGNDYV